MVGAGRQAFTGTTIRGGGSAPGSPVAGSPVAGSAASIAAFPAAVAPGLSPEEQSGAGDKAFAARGARARHGQTILLGLFLPLVVALGWELAVGTGLVEGRLIPPPSKIGHTFYQLAETGELWTHAAVTLWRVAAGFGLGAAAGILFGALSGTSALARRLLDPTLQALRAIPSIAWVPLFILWFGIFEASKITLIAVGVVFPVYLGIAEAILSVDRKLVEVGRVFRLSRPALAWRILLPAVLPEAITSLRSGLGLGFMFVVAAEFMGASEGLGYLLTDGQQLGKPAQILAAIIAFALIGKASDALLVAATNPLIRWQDRVRDRL